MTEIRSPKQYDLEDRTLAFAKKVRAFVKKLRKTIANIEDGVAANVIPADLIVVLTTLP